MPATLRKYAGATIVDSEDELDLLTSTAPTLVASSEASSTYTTRSNSPDEVEIKPKRVVLRYASATYPEKPPSSKSRKRKVSESDIENVGAVVAIHKKAKKEEKKAVCSPFDISERPICSLHRSPAGYNCHQHQTTRRRGSA